MTDDNLLLDGLNDDEIRQMAIALRRMCGGIYRVDARCALDGETRERLVANAYSAHTSITHAAWDRQDAEAARMPGTEENAPAAL